MPLTYGQRETIKSMISHFFDLPTEGIALFNSVTEFKLAWLQQLSNDHDLASFQSCIHQPTHFLRLIENQNPDITIDEVQRYLFNFTKRSLINAAKKLGFPASIIDFKANLLLAPVIKKQYKQAFKTTSLITQRNIANQYSFETPGRLYKAVMKPDWEMQKLYLILTIAVTPAIDITIEMADFPIGLDFDRRGFLFAHFINTQSARVEEIAYNEALKIISSSLNLDLNHLSSSEKTLLTYQFYYQQAKENIHLLPNFMNPPNTELCISMIGLIRAGKLNTQAMLDLTPSEKNILLNPFYQSETLTGKIVNPNQLTPEFAHFLIQNPFVERHSKKNNIAETLAKIAKYSNHDLLFLPNNYQDDILAPRKLFSLCKTNVTMRLQALLSARPLILANGSEDSFAQLISSCDTCQINFDKILDEEIILRQTSYSIGIEAILLNQAALGLSDLRLQSLTFGKRLLNLSLMAQRSNDSIEKLQNNMYLVAANMNLPDLPNAVIRVFLEMFKENIDDFGNDAMQPYKTIYAEITKANVAALEKKEESAKLLCWRNAFDQILVAAENEKQSSKKVDSYLTPSSARHEKRQCISSTLFVTPSLDTASLCDQIIQIGKMMQNDGKAQLKMSVSLL